MQKKCCLGLLIVLVGAAIADDEFTADPPEWYNLHYQQTVVVQGRPRIKAPYTGANSLQPEAEVRTSVTSTLFVGFRLWKGGELYVNPELAGGRGLSGAVGIAGFPNGEIFRVGDPTPTPFIARLYFQQRWALGTEEEELPDEPNQLPGQAPMERLIFALGKFALTDLFDDNQYAHDPRLHFLNWALMSNGAWDYAADTRGYTWGMYAEYKRATWALRSALTMVPREANGMEFDTRVRDAFSVNLEAEYSYAIRGCRGVVRLLLYRNQARMGSYRLAIQQALYNGTTPDIEQTREYSRTKYRFGINVEQQLSEVVGIFARLGWNDGVNETWAFTEIDRSVTLGGVMQGKVWGRPRDHAGMAVIVNGLSQPHRDYLARGGYGFIIGDGALRYAPEFISEVYYSIAIAPWLILTPNYQFVLNPAYNADRGPVHIFALRFHTDY